MFDQTTFDRNDALGQRLRSACGKANPPPALERAVKLGVPYAGKVSTGLHVRKFAKAVVSYAVCVVLLLGAVYLGFRLLSTQTPAATQPPVTAPTDTTDSIKPVEPTDSFPYTALPNDPELLLRLAQYGAPEVMDAKLNALGLKLSTKPLSTPSMAELRLILRDLGYDAYTTINDPLNNGSQPYDDATYTTVPLACYPTETGELVLIHSLIHSKQVTPYRNLLMMVLKSEGDTYKCIANFHPDHHITGRITDPNTTAKVQYNVNRLLNILALSGTKPEITQSPDEATLTALKDYLSSSPIIETRTSFYKPEHYDLYELALSNQAVSSLTARKYGLTGDETKWCILKHSDVENQLRTHLGISLAPKAWDALSEQCWDGSSDVVYVEEINTHFVYMEKERNSFALNQAFQAFETTDGRMIVYLLNDDHHVTVLLNPTEDGSYHIGAVQVLEDSNIPDEEAALFKPSTLITGTGIETRTVALPTVNLPTVALPKITVFPVHSPR
ncbi:MAG: hypothetical protein IJW62_07795 [Clostridia bacterium]|nr:hypothetical protein [Clostridia bacterium]